MKYLKDVIIEKLIINKDSKLKDYNFDNFCKALYLGTTNDKENYAAECLYDEYKKDCDNIIDNNFDGKLFSTNFELLFMLVVMLLDDQYSPTGIKTIGTKYYTNHFGNKNNPYDFSWFEVENSKNTTVLEVIQNLYESNKNFKKYFEQLYNWTSISCKDYQKAIDGIWILCDKI